MDFKKWIMESLEILQLKEDAIRRVASDDEATLPAFLFPAIAGLAGAIGTLNPLGIVGIVLVPVFVAIAAGIYLLIAKLFGGTGEFMNQLRPMGLSHIISWVSVVPLLGPMVSAVAGLWLIAVFVVIIKTIHNLSTEKAIAVVVLPLVVCCTCIGLAIAIGLGGGLAQHFAHPAL